jgi:hypothetical protein
VHFKVGADNRIPTRSHAATAHRMVTGARMGAQKGFEIQTAGEQFLRKAEGLQCRL